MNKKRLLSGVLVLMLLMAFMPQIVQAADYTISDSETFDLSSASDGDTVIIEAEAAATITGSKKVKIECGAGVTLTLDAVSIDVSETNDACALSFTGKGNTLILTGESTLKSGANEPGVRVEDATALEIYGSGSLTVTGGAEAAGIGGGSVSSGGFITISGGVIDANGGERPREVSGHIFMEEGGAGIGSGYGGNGATVGITGGTITITGDAQVRATGAVYSAGIGGGDNDSVDDIGASGGTITISGEAVVIAQGGYGGAGIGGGYEGIGGNIRIEEDVQVTATGGGYAAGIGGGDYGGGGKITITGGNVEATGGEDAAGIGSGEEGFGGEISISGEAHVTAQGGDNSGAGIGGGEESDGGTITISGNTQVTATGGGYAAGIGGGDEGDGGTITISDNAEVTATGDVCAAGIGGGDDASGGITKISGGVVNATGGSWGAGIGCGSWYDDTITAGYILISGGVISAAGGEYAAGIGGGEGANGGTIVINGGIVYAIKAENGSYDIGKGSEGSDGTIEISGSAEVFIGTNSTSPTPATSTHTLYEFTEDTEEAFGVPVPSEWTPTFGAYLILYELKYDSNDGEGPAPPSITDRALGTKTLVADNTFFYSGHVFNGWNTDRNGEGDPYEPGDEFIFEENTTLYAQWLPLYTLEYDKNGGEGPLIDSVTQKKGTSTEVEENVYTKSGYGFDCWNTDKYGEGDSYMPGDEFIFTGNTTLYAQWLPLYTLGYDKNGGEGSPMDSVTQKKGTSTTVKENTFTNDLYDFCGWNTSDDGKGSGYMPGDEFIFWGDTTLYAQWQEMDILVYDANGAINKAPSPSLGFEDGGIMVATVKGADALRYTKQQFSGWNTKQNGSGTSYKPGDVISLNGITTLFAQWIPLYTLEYDANGGNGTSPSFITQGRGSSTFAAANPYTYIGHEFTGWNTSADGSGTLYMPGEECDLNDSMTLYAQWTLPVIRVRLSSSSRDIIAGHAITLTATVYPSNADDADVTWTSTDTSIAKVSQSGKVTAVSTGAASIIAKADGAYAVCTILVESEPGDYDDSGNNDDGAPSLSPTPTVSPSVSPQPGGEGKDSVDEAGTGGEAQQPAEQGVDKRIITIVVTDLPEGTAAIKLPDGRIIEVGKSSTLQIEVDKEHASGDDIYELTALDDEGIPLGTFTADAKAANIPLSTSAFAWWWIAIGALVLVLGGCAAWIILLRRKL